MTVETKRQELLALDKQKKALTDEAEAIISELTAEAPNGVSAVLCLFFVTVSTVHSTQLCYSLCDDNIYIVYDVIRRNG